MRRSLRLYLPFIALVAVQALFASVAPSDGPGRRLTSGEAALPLPAPSGSDPGAPPADGTGTTVAGADPGAPGATAGGGGSGGGSGSSDVGSGGGSGGGAAVGPPAEGDRSHCAGDGRQTGVVYFSPPCVPKWTGGDNGGSTYPGVTDKEITVVGFYERPNAQVNALLESQGLATNPRDRDAFNAAAIEFVNKHYELYGRKIKLVTFEADCPQTPQNVPACKEAARRVARTKPFLVFWQQAPIYSSVFDEWVREGIVSIGGWNFDERMFTQRRPYRYDVFMDGTRMVRHVAEYYCKKLSGKNASHAGRVIHPTIGSRDTTKRKLGVVVADDPANIPVAQLLSQLVKECDRQDVPIFPYESDITRAAEQSAATTAALIQAKVTTIVCVCDPISPVFGTQGRTRQNYYPEWLLPGGGLLDYDLLGRLYDPAQWEHAFGPSHLSLALPIPQTDAGKVWRAMGRPGNPCSGCNIPWAYINLAASLVQMAGPNLTPLTLERAALSLPARGGSGTGHEMFKMGPGDYTALEDVREVYWSRTAVSRVDGRPGAYVEIDGGRRWTLNSWTREFKVPQPAA